MELIQAIVPPLLRHAGETEIYSLVLKLNSGTRGKKPAVGELSRVLAQARVIPASRRWRNAEQSQKVPRPRFRHSTRAQRPRSRLRPCIRIVPAQSTAAAPCSRVAVSA